METGKSGAKRDKTMVYFDVMYTYHGIWSSPNKISVYIGDSHSPDRGL